MDEEKLFTESEAEEYELLRDYLREHIAIDAHSEQYVALTEYVDRVLQGEGIPRNVFGLNVLLLGMQAAKIVIAEIGLQYDAAEAALLYAITRCISVPSEEISRVFGATIATIVRSLQDVQELYAKSGNIQSENFRNLLLSFSADVRVVLIMLADRVNIMRQIRDTENLTAQREIAQEASYLYAPLAHKLGLYMLKSELEDLSLKYLEHDAYYAIRAKLSATKTARDAYISAFIGPVEEAITNAGLKCHIKGRTKSIHSIWQKMKKQKCEFEGIYDLFAIRIILDSAADREHQDCWQTFSIITNMYVSNPKRMRDWLSVPKSNGYESLHITVLGPQNKWVEVQIRTERMDAIAENGIAAHWRYKGVRDGGGIDAWLADIRHALEAGDNLQVMDEFKLSLYDKEVYVFSPKGDLYKLAKGATVLDFAYYIHSNVGSHCTGAKINNRIVSIREPLHSGDQVEILTHTNQTPKSDWLNIVKTSRARAKLRLALKESQLKESAMAKELLIRRLKNRKIDLEEGTISHVVNKLGYKQSSDFYMAIASGQLDVNTVIEKYIEVRNYDLGLNAPAATRSAEEFTLQPEKQKKGADSSDVMTIDANVKGIDYSLAKCCNPIYGDDVFGFVTVNGGIKIHRQDCPNATELFTRFGYRIVRAQWSGKGDAQYAVTIRVIGNDDIGIVNNITSIISKEEKTTIRAINIDSHDGLFSGVITLMVSDIAKMKNMIKKIRTVKGVKQVERL